jgi:hypothetical protein
MNELFAFSTNFGDMTVVRRDVKTLCENSLRKEGKIFLNGTRAPFLSFENVNFSPDEIQISLYIICASLFIIG